MRSDLDLFPAAHKSTIVFVFVLSPGKTHNMDLGIKGCQCNCLIVISYSNVLNVH